MEVIMLFFEVFDTLNVENEIYELFSDISVLKALVSKNNGNVHIYIQSTHLISRKQIKMMEFQLQKQLFSSTKSRVKLIENYQLSSQYTPESLWDMHSENILEELNDNSVMNYNILRMAEISFDGFKMIIKLPDTFLNQKKSEEIKVFLEPMFEQRFCIPVDLRFEFYELIEEAKDEEEYPQVRREKIKQNAVQSMETSGEVSDEIRSEIPFELSSSNKRDDNLVGRESLENKSELNIGKKEEKKQIKEDKFSQPEKKNSAYDKAKAYKKKLPDDPDIIYGRPFEGDSIPIKDIQEEIGEVVIRGKILSTEERELRNEKFLISFNVTDFTDTISAKIFVRSEEIEDIRGQVKKGMFIRMKGMALYDTYRN